VDHIIDGVLKFQREVFPNEKALYRELSIAQAPEAMFIGCADSRVVPELLTQQGPGGLFVVRNAGNIVPPWGPEPGGVTASLEYAIAVLGIRDIVLCGHSGCGAMTALVNGVEKISHLPAVAKWLHYADSALDAVADSEKFANDAERLNAVVHENVLVQLDNLLTHPTVHAAVNAGHLRLHGWVFDIATAGIETYDASVRKFVPISSAPFASATT
jgi:carbonic anhydrase